MSPASSVELLAARGLTRHYGGQSWPRRSAPHTAFADVDLELTAGRVLGLVGSSGAGKSSLARCLALLERADSGTLHYRGADTAALSGRELERFRRDVQLVFQDATRSFHPFWSSRQVLEEPLRLAGADAPRPASERLAALVGLDASELERPARLLSGGQKKRLSLARALATEPSVLILDEPFSGLDVSLKAAMANLVESLRLKMGFACLHISHDLAMVSRLADDVAVIDRGRIVESGSVAHVLRDPSHPATRALVAAGSLRKTAGGAP